MTFGNITMQTTFISGGQVLRTSNTGLGEWRTVAFNIVDVGE